MEAGNCYRLSSEEAEPYKDSLFICLPALVEKLDDDRVLMNNRIRRSIYKQAATACDENA